MNVQLVAVAPLPSVTLIVNVPAAFGVPLTRPVLLSARPYRRSAHHSRLQSSVGLMVNVQLVAVAPLPSVTFIVNVPAAFGVPLTKPVQRQTRQRAAGRSRYTE